MWKIILYLFSILFLPRQNIQKLNLYFLDQKSNNREKGFAFSSVFQLLISICKPFYNFSNETIFWN